MKLKFPKNFYWGTATSAYQVEGGIRNDWSEAGGKFDAGIACDHYNRYEEDFDLAEQMNNNAHRFSIEWARIEPEEGRFNLKEIEHYRKVIKALRIRAMEPFITLYHWTTPIWFAKKGGWLNKKAIDYFTRYVKFVVENLPDVKFWIVLNEPMVYISHSFIKGEWPLFKKNWFKAQKVLKQLVKVHKKAYKIIHEISPDSQVGIAKMNIYFQGILKPIGEYSWNKKFLKAIKNYQDFVGLNYYFSRAWFGGFLGEQKTDLGWGIYPKGIYYVLKDLKKYNKSIYITENGLADANDSRREDFIIQHLKWVHRAIKEEIDVRGYFHWSLIDNFEWDSRFEPRFGLIEIDYKTLKRIPRPSSKVYAEICKNNAIKI